jgi:N-acetylglutamate synthase-like GNAT family acetyltransferase
MEYRRAQRNDIDMIVENRIEFVTSIAKIQNIAEFKDITKRYIEEHIDKDDLIIYIAIENNEIIASCMSCIYMTVPLASCLSGKYAELLNVYTKKEYRRKGHAERIISILSAELKEYGVEKIKLNYTDSGYPLYEKMGFKKLDRDMELTL